MTTRTVDLDSQQELRVDVGGPNGANQMLIFTGTVGMGCLGSNRGEHKRSIAFNVGPRLTRAQFHRAIASASLAQITVNNPASGNYVVQWSIDEVDADWDDETNSVEVRVEVSVFNPHDSCTTMIQRVAYHVIILAQL